MDAENLEKTYSIPKGDENPGFSEKKGTLKNKIFVTTGVLLVIVWFVGRAMLIAHFQVERDMQKKERERSAQAFRQSLEAEARQTGLSIDGVIDKRIREYAEAPAEGKTKFEQYTQKVIKKLIEKQQTIPPE